MRASTKLIMALALLLSAGSVKLAQSAPYADPNDPGLWGGGSLGWNRGQSSALQNTRHYPRGLDPLKGAGYWDIPHGTDVNAPLLWGAGSLGWNRGQSSALQNTRHYPDGHDPLKADWEITVHHTHH
jgi:hypothetical protein